MKKGIALAAALGLGLVVGACVRSVVSEAHAQPVGPGFSYKVVGGSLTGGGAEEDLNRFGGEGWRFVGVIGRDLVFERPH